MLGHCLEHYRWYYNSKENRITSSVLHFKLLGWVFSARILKILSETKPHSAKSCMKHYHHWKNYSCLLRGREWFQEHSRENRKKSMEGMWRGKLKKQRGMMGRCSWWCSDKRHCWENYSKHNQEQIVIKWLRMSLRE